MSQKSEKVTAIIGGAAAPTSILMSGKSKKKPLNVRIRNAFYRFRRKRVEQKITANPHTLAEVIEYVRLNYELTEMSRTKRAYKEAYQSLKERLILQYKSEVLGEMKDIPVPEIFDESSVRDYVSKFKTRSEMIAKMPDDILPMDFHLYRIRRDDSFLEIRVDFIWNIFNVSYSGSKKMAKQFENISKELYLYYGVSEEDIKKKTKRYSLLVEILGS